MKNTLFVFLVVVLFSCHKEPQQTPCAGDGLVTLELFNGFAYPVDIRGSGPGTDFGYIIYPGKRYKFNVTAGSWTVKAHWTDGNAPFAHNEGDFDKTIDVQDCPDAVINYPF
jgi:hypothetical protein